MRNPFLSATKSLTRIYITGDYVTNKAKLDAIIELLEDDSILVYIAVESYEERTANTSIVSYDYSIVEKKPQSNNGKEQAEQEEQEEEEEMIFEEGVEAEFLDASQPAV